MHTDHEAVTAEIMARLSSLVDELPETPDWHKGWSRLRGDSSPDERLAVYRSIRDAGTIPEAAALYLIAMQVEEISRKRAGRRLTDLEERLEAIAESQGVDEDESWLPGEAPPEYGRLREELARARAEEFLKALEACREGEVAALFREDRERFDELYEEGQQYFHGPEGDSATPLPDWMDELVDTVASHLSADNALGPLGIRYRRDEEAERWEVIIHPTPVELVGGAVDGAVVSPSFSLDLRGLQEEFEEVEGCGLCSHGLYQDEGAFLWIDGEWQGRPLTLRVLIHAPDNEAPGSKLDVNHTDDE